MAVLEVAAEVGRLEPDDGQCSQSPVSGSDRIAKYEALFRQNFSPVYRYLLARLGSRPLAEDICEEVFATAWRRLDDVPFPERPWLFGVARHMVVAQRRKEVRRRLALRRLSSQPLVPERSSEAAERDAKVLSALRGKDAELVRLLYWDGLTQAEAAQVVGLSPNAVAVRVHRIRKRLADQLGPNTRGTCAGNTEEVEVDNEHR